MKAEKIECRYISILLALTFSVIPIHPVEGKSDLSNSFSSVGAYSTQVNLDLSRVAIHISVHPNLEYQDLLYARIIKHFKEKGLLEKSWISNPVHPIAELTFILKVVPTDCPDKVLSLIKVELVEEVTIKRVPFFEDMRAMTWFYGQTNYALTNEKTIKDLEKDLDDLLQVFVLDHLNAGNEQLPGFQ